MPSKPIRLAAGFVAFSLLMAAAALGLGFLFRLANPKPAKTVSGLPAQVIILDAGHGGEDGGTSAKNGVLEKDVNLDVVQKLGALLTLSGYSVVYTREDDRLLYTENIRGTRKMQDLRSRLETARRFEDPLFVSIHANSFPVEKYRGLQVYYSPNDARSREVAESIQSAAAAFLQPENHRAVKKADSTIYLLDRIETPGVLIECGFLSNPDEAALLGDPGYRYRLAAVLYKALTDFLENNKNHMGETGT